MGCAGVQKMFGINRGGRAIETEEIAAILSYGDIHGDSAAARQFGVSLRTVQRYRKKLKLGSDPELTQAVAEKSRTVAEKYGDLMDEVFELALQALKTRVQTAHDNVAPIEDRALIGAIKILGDQRVTRDFLADEDDEEDDEELGDGLGIVVPRNTEATEGTAPRAASSEEGEAPRARTGSVH